MLAYSANIWLFESGLVMCIFYLLPYCYEEQTLAWMFVFEWPASGREPAGGGSVYEARNPMAALR